MSSYQPLYRITIYAPRSTDSTEATVLSVSGTDCKFATASGISGFLPYLDSVEGRAGRMDPLTRHLDVGTWEVVLLDPRTGTSNLVRAVTAIIGNAAGANQLMGLKVYLEESTDNGSNWSALTTGRIVATRLHDQTPGCRLVLRVRDMASELDVPVLVGRPHASATGAGPMQILPVGLAAAYGDFPLVSLLSGTIKASTAGSGKKLDLSSSARASAKNILDDALRQESVTYNNPTNPRYSQNVQVYIVRGDTGAAGYLRLGEVEVTGAGVGGAVANIYNATSMIVDALPNQSVTITRSGSTATATVASTADLLTGMTVVIAGANQSEYNGSFTITVTGSTTFTFTVSGTPASPATGTITCSRYLGYIPLPPNNTAVTFAIRRVGAAPDEATPLFVDDIHPATFIKHLLSGYYSYLLADGRVKRSHPYDSTIMAAMEADASYPLVRFRFTRSYRLYELIETICQQVGMGYRLGGDGEVELFDMRFPSVAPSPNTITDADLVAEIPPAWEQTREQAIAQVAVQYYEDTLGPSTPFTSIADAITRFLNRINTSGVMEISKWLVDAESFENPDVGARPYTIDAICLRQAAGETVPSGTNGTIDRDPWTQGLAAQLAQSFRRPYATGPATLRLTLRRTATALALKVGDLVLCSASKVPDPSTNQRGGTRLYRVLEASRRGLGVPVVLQDAGPNTVATAPTLGTLSAGPDAQKDVQFDVTLNAAGDPVVVEVATTDTSTGTAPAESSGAWHRVRPVNVSALLIVAPGTYWISNQPAGQRVWVRIRSEPAPSRDAKLPSPWAFSTGTDYLDITGLSAPSAVTNSPSNSPGNTDTVTLGWTAGSANLPVEVQLVYVSGAGSSVTNIPILPAGSVALTLNDYLTANTVYTPRVRHVDGLGGVSAWANASNLTIGGSFTGPALTAPTSLTLTAYAA